ncbi:GNAT family N-acetyltransferase [Methanocella conradii]|uniref:GNAT family N-acetyltransferase n=1 Tax=Methanocella conradii TaxID=1175444 RepID=UPI0020C6EFB7|nr:GNAT family N-acetyltransferase [Methanocella conradii]
MMRGHLNQATGGVHVRPATEGDVESMYALEQMCFDVEAFSAHQLQYLINAKTAYSFVAEYDDAFAGFIIGLTNRNRFGKYGRIYTLDVDYRFRRRGIATILLKTLMERLRQAGCTNCFLEVKVDNDKAITLYEKMGFERSRIVPNYYSDGVHALKMKKTL